MVFSDFGGSRMEPEIRPCLWGGWFSLWPQKDQILWLQRNLFVTKERSPHGHREIPLWPQRHRDMSQWPQRDLTVAPERSGCGHREISGQFCHRCEAPAETASAVRLSVRPSDPCEAPAETTTTHRPICARRQPRPPPPSVRPSVRPSDPCDASAIAVRPSAQSVRGASRDRRPRPSV